MTSDREEGAQEALLDQAVARLLDELDWSWMVSMRIRRRDGWPPASANTACTASATVDRVGAGAFVMLSVSDGWPLVRA